MDEERRQGRGGRGFVAVVALLYRWLHGGLAVLAALFIAFIAVGISADVLSRNLGGGTLRGMLELSEYSLFLSTFLGAPWVLRLGAHVRVDVVVENLPARVGWVLEIVGDLFGLVTSGVLFWYGARIAAVAFEENRRVIKEFIFPEGWLYVVVAFVAALLIVEFILRLWRARTGPARTDAPPAAEGL